MALDFAEDLAVFFATDEFGEAIIYEGVGEIGAIWDRPTGEGRLVGMRISMPTHVFHIAAVNGLQPTEGKTIEVVRTGERFSIFGSPSCSADGRIWHCPAEPIR